MKSILILVFFLLTSFPFDRTAPLPPQWPFSLTISSPQTSFKSGSRVWVKLIMTNTSKRAITLEDANPACDYQLDVRDANGNAVPDTEFKTKLNCTSPRLTGRDIIYSLKPHESRQDEIVLNSMSQMTQPGTYFVQLARKIPRDLGKGVVKSNVVSVEVTD
jgi:hypothetical protein